MYDQVNKEWVCDLCGTRQPHDQDMMYVSFEPLPDADNPLIVDLCRRCQRAAIKTRMRFAGVKF